MTECEVMVLFIQEFNPLYNNINTHDYTYEELVIIVKETANEM